MKFEVKHIYDSTVADKNAIVANALQFNIVAGSNIETTPSTANTYEFYYKYEELFKTSLIYETAIKNAEKRCCENNRNIKKRICFK